MKSEGTKDEALKMEKRRKPETALVESGRLICPYCGGYNGDAYYGASCCNVVIPCRNDRCKKPMRIEL